MDRRSPVLAAIRRSLDAPGAPGASAHLLVACSAGPDSTALLLALAEELGPTARLSAAYVDHGLRGAEAVVEAAFVAELAGTRGIPAFTRTAAVGHGPNLEARARRARYGALASLAREIDAAAIVTAHTRDDQVETLFLRLLRGAGRGGLGGMRPRAGMIWRPMLAVGRADVRAFLAQRGATFLVDRSNADLRFRRNRVRRLLIPFLEAEFNTRLGPAMAALADRLRDEDAYLDAVARAQAASLVDGFRLSTAIAGEPRAVARRIVHGWLKACSVPGTGAVHVERVLTLAGRTHGSVGLPGPARVVCEPPWLVYRATAPETTASFRLELAAGGTTVHPGGRWRLSRSRAEACTDTSLAGAGPSLAVFDADLLPERLIVRPPARGDRIHVAAVGTRKVHDVLIDAHVPREARPAVPVVTDGETILWVAGVSRGSAARVTPGTRRVERVVLETAALSHR